MLRFILRRLAVIPVALVLVHFLGFSYAHYARPIRAKRTPYLRYLPETQPLIPTYFEHWQGAISEDLGVMPDMPDSRRSVLSAESESLAYAVGIRGVL